MNEEMLAYFLQGFAFILNSYRIAVHPRYRTDIEIRLCDLTLVSKETFFKPMIIHIDQHPSTYKLPSIKADINQFIECQLILTGIYRRKSFTSKYSLKSSSQSAFEVLKKKILSVKDKGTVVSQLTNQASTGQPLSTFVNQLEKQLALAGRDGSVRRILHMRYQDENLQQLFDIFVFMYVEIGDEHDALAIYITDRKFLERDHILQFSIEPKIQDACKLLGAKTVRHIFIELSPADYDLGLKPKSHYCLATKFLLMSCNDVNKKLILLYYKDSSTQVNYRFVNSLRGTYSEVSSNWTDIEKIAPGESLMFGNYLDGKKDIHSKLISVGHTGRHLTKGYVIDTISESSVKMKETVVQSHMNKRPYQFTLTLNDIQAANENPKRQNFDGDGMQLAYFISQGNAGQNNQIYQFSTNAYTNQDDIRNMYEVEKDYETILQLATSDYESFKNQVFRLCLSYDELSN